MVDLIIIFLAYNQLIPVFIFYSQTSELLGSSVRMLTDMDDGHIIYQQKEQRSCGCENEIKLLKTAHYDLCSRIGQVETSLHWAWQKFNQVHVLKYIADVPISFTS